MNFTATKLKQARDAGYSDDEIWGFVAEQDDRFTQAKDVGYSLDEVSGFFSEQEQPEAAQPEAQVATEAPVGTSFIEEVRQIPQALQQAIEQPLEAMGETAEVLGAPKVSAALRGATTAPEGYVSATQRFMEPQEGEFQIGGFAPQFLPRAIVEQGAQVAGSIATSAAGRIVGGLVGSVGGPVGRVTGATVGQFLGPALFEMSQIVGPAARERAKNQGREEPTTDDLAWAWATAGASGALNAIGARYLPNGDKLTGPLSQRIATTIAGEGSTEGLQNIVQQTGQTFLTESGFNIEPKEAIGETIIGGGAGGAATLIAAPFTPTPEKKAEVAAETVVAAQSSTDIAPATADAVSQQAATVIEEAKVEVAETPEQRVARLQEEATAAAGIELEEEGVGVEPTVPVTPPVEPTPEGAVAPVEPVVTPEVAEPQPAAEVAPTEPVAPEVAPTTTVPSDDLLQLDTREELNRLTSEGMTREEAIADLKRRRTEQKQSISDSVNIGDEIVVTTNAETGATRKFKIVKAGQGKAIQELNEQGGSIGPELSLDPNAGISGHGFIAGGQIVRPEAAPAVTPPAEVAPTPEAVAPTPNLEPLRRVARAEQTPEDVPSLVDAGLVEVYKDQPVLTEAGIAQLPEAERPRLTPEARKIQIDTGANEVVAEAISKNLRIGVDQVGTGVRMPTGWTLVEDIYVPPKPMERITEFTITPEYDVEETADVFASIWGKRPRIDIDKIVADARAKRQNKPFTTSARPLTPKEFLEKSIRTALRAAAKFNFNPATRKSEAMFADIAAILSEAPIPALDDENIIKLSSRNYRGRERRFWGGDIGMASTKGMSIRTFIHEVGHSLTADQLRKYGPQTRGAKPINGKEYIDQLRTLSGDDTIPQPVRDIFTLYVSTIDQLGLMNFYGSPRGLAGTPNPDVSMNRALKLQSEGKIPSNFTRSDFYALANIYEFVSQTFSSKSFQDKLNNLKSPINANKTLWQEFITAIRQIFGFPSDSMTAAVVEATVEISMSVPAARLSALLDNEGYLVGFKDALELKNYLEANPNKNMGDAKDDFRKRFNREPNQFAGQNAKAFSKPEIESEIKKYQKRVDEYRKTIPSGTVPPPAPAPEVRESRREPAPLTQQDREYLDAVSGDNRNDNLQDLVRGSRPEDRPIIYQQWAERNPRAAELLQRVADSAAKVAGFRFGPVFHGTKELFNIFRSDKYEDKLIYFSEREQFSREWARGRKPRQEILDRINKVRDESKKYVDGLFEAEPALTNNERDLEIAARHFEKQKEFERQRLDGMTVSEAQRDAGIRLVRAYLKADNIFDPTKNWREFLPQILARLGLTSESEIEPSVMKGIQDGNYLIWEDKNVMDAVLSKYDAIRIQETSGGPADTIAVRDPAQIKLSDAATFDDQGNIIPPSQRFQPTEEDIRYKRIEMPRPAGMAPEAVATKLESLGFGRGGIVSVVNEPDASFEGRTIIRDGKVVGIELNAAALKDDAAIERVLNHEIAESANADGALNRLVAGLTPKERKEINDAITRLGYAERARTAEEAARAVELLAEGWRGRRWFERAVARIEAWANKLGYKLTRRAAEYIAARNVSEINAEFKQAYNKFINVQGEAREGRAFVTPAENARFLELAQNPEANREELQKMVDAAAKKAGYNVKGYHGTDSSTFSVFDIGPEGGMFFTDERENARIYGRRIIPAHISIKNPYRVTWSEISEELDGDPSLSPWSIGFDQLKKQGFDGIIVVPDERSISYDEEVGELEFSYPQFIVFESSQIKSADPVTRDNQGNVIPLSERFQPTTPDIRYSIRESRREDAIPTFSEGSPEASTLSNMKESMAKVDAASEAKPNPENKPTYKISEIASVWMDQGGDARQLQDMIEENTLLSPANAKKVANAIAKQYDIQQSIAEAQVETAEGISLEGLPEGVSIPKEADPKRPKTVIQRLIDVTTGVRVPPVKITATERSLLNNQIRMRAAANREAKKAQQETANEVVEIIKAMELRGPVRPKQAQALAKRAAKVIWTSEKSMESFMAYAEKVVANTNYDADLREAKAAQKRALELSKRSTVASPQQEILANIAKIGVNMLDNPREFAEVVNYYMRGFKPVPSPDYLVVPDDEITSYLSQAEDIVEEAKMAFDRVVTERLSEKYGVSPDRIQEILDAQDIERALVQYAKREVAEAIINERANEVLAGLKAYDQTGLRADQRKIIDSILKLDPSILSSQEKQQFVRVGNNIIFNNQTHGAELFAVTAKGQQMAKEAASNEDLIAKNTAWVNVLPSLRSRTLQKTWRNWALELQSVADTFRNAFGKGAMAKVYRMMGMYDLDRGFTAAANTVNQIQEEIAAFYNNLEKKYKAAARNQDGILAEGIVGFLIQKVPEKGEVESLAQRRNLIQQDIRNRRISQDADRIAMADRIERILQQLDGESVSDIMANLKRDYRANYESVTWLKDTLFPKYKDFLKRFDENFNDQANNYESPDYLPIGFIRAGVSLAITPENEAMYYEHVSLRPKQSSYTIKRADYTQLPTDKTTNKPKEIEFNLRRNAFDSLSDQINKAYTSPAWQQIFAFMKTPESEKLFGGAANKEFFIERLNRLRLSRMRRGSMSTGYIEKTADALSVMARKLGTGIALGGAYQPFKQAPDQIIAAIGTTGRADLMAENMSPVNLKAAKAVLDKFSIGRRGDASSGYKYINQMEGAQNKIERYLSESRWDAAKEQAGKIADVWLLALKKTDYVFAAGAWMTYYRAQLAKDGVKFQGWEKEAELLETDTARQDAASYAEQMTDIYQGSSDPTKMATFVQSGKSGWENLFKAIFVPFNSFAVQQRMRIYSDARDVFTKSGDRAAGGIGLAATIGGLLAFHSVRRFALPALTGLGVSMLYAAFGVDMDEPDEEKKAEDFAKRWRQFLGEFTANLLVGGSGQIVEAATIDSFNYAAYLIAMQAEDETVLNDKGEIMSFSQYSKERSPFWRYRSFDNAMSLGMFDIGIDQGKKAILETKALMSPEEMENFTTEEQRLLYFAALSDWLYLMRLNDADFARMVDRARREIRTRSKETEKELARIRAGR